ncbi:amidohydrolase family protein [Propioniciclava flava]|uniref:amidohydrolase family protein n=1 Tax=Propioniciclava flava TaxID=2072026 RepID=UPI001F4FAB93|nr:amidohydrolase family protein [Propioniciclava flava]
MNLAITGAHIVPITAEPFEGTIVMTDGHISSLGPRARIPKGHAVLDAEGAWVLPGFIDAHVHLGVHEEGEGWAGNDTNEATNPVMAAARALDAINPMEKGFDDALSGGVTSVNVNPGSGNPIGGLTVAIKTFGRVVDEMVMRSPSGLKAALGENPKRFYGEQKKTPSTRLGTALTIREAFVAARNVGAQESPEQNLVTMRCCRCSTVRSRGVSTATAPTTSRPPCGWRRSSATTSSSITAPKAGRSLI